MLILQNTSLQNILKESDQNIPYAFSLFMHFVFLFQIIFPKGIFQSWIIFLASCLKHHHFLPRFSLLFFYFLMSSRKPVTASRSRVTLKVSQSLQVLRAGEAAALFLSFRLCVENFCVFGTCKISNCYLVIYTRVLLTCDLYKNFVNFLSRRKILLNFFFLIYFFTTALKLFRFAPQEQTSLLCT